MIAFAAAAQFLFLCLFFYSAMRYLLDFYFLLMLLIVIAVYELDRRIQGQQKLRTAFWSGVSFLSLMSAGIGLVVAFDITPKTILNENPAVFSIINAVFLAVKRFLRNLIHLVL